MSTKHILIQPRALRSLCHGLLFPLRLLGGLALFEPASPKRASAVEHKASPDDDAQRTVRILLRVPCPLETLINSFDGLLCDRVLDRVLDHGRDLVERAEQLVMREVLVRRDLLPLALPPRLLYSEPRIDAGGVCEAEGRERNLRRSVDELGVREARVADERLRLRVGVDDRLGGRFGGLKNRKRTSEARPQARRA